jgi:pimeloyl-ACP methyl ester carboxylesterase
MSRQAQDALARVDLPQGTITYREHGPRSSSFPTVVFVHGFLVNSELWTPVAERLADQGIHSIAPNWPLGSHPIPMKEDADLSPAGCANLINTFLEAFDLSDVTLVGSDTGGALCQFTIDADQSRIGRLVLTNCDAFELFPPPEFALVARLGRNRRLLRLLMAGMTFTPLRLTRGYGLVFTNRPDPALTRSWIEPARRSQAICNDGAKILSGMRPEATADVARRFGNFRKPVHLVWGDSDAFFPLELAERLVAAFPDASLRTIPGARTFVSLDHPDVVADVIATASGSTA